MGIRIFHSSDNHIGMNYLKYPDAVRTALIEARFESLRKMVRYANEEQADLFVISGDLFNSLSISDAQVKRTADILREFSGLTLILPGNHDYYSGGERAWQTFHKVMNEETLLLIENKPYSLKPFGMEAVVYPAHCHDKHSAENNLGWIKQQPIDPGVVNIGVAHGAIEGLSPDLAGSYYFMSRTELTSIPVDLWLIGHTHVPYPLDGRAGEDRIYNAGTHEPDGLNYRQEGSGFLIDINEDKSLHSSRYISGIHRFFDLQLDLKGEQTLEQGIDELLNRVDGNTLLRVEVQGYIDRLEFEQRHLLYQRLEESCLYFEVMDADLKIRLAPEDIDETYVEGSFPQRFLKGLIGDERALQLAYELVEKSREERGI